MAIKVLSYSDSLKPAWDFVLINSINGLFLFRREFMDYHRDRFSDSSLILFKDQKAIGIFPCNTYQGCVFSHQGLSFGGIILIDGINQDDILTCVDVLLNYWSEQGIKKVEIKLVPDIYCICSQERLKNSLLKKGFKSQSPTQTYVTDLSTSFKPRVGRWKLRNSHRKGFLIEEVNDFSNFWNQILIPLYKEKIGVPPTHTLEEIHQLKSKNRGDIRQFVVSLSNNQILAGITVFEYLKVAKFQYIAASNLGKKLRALDVLIEYLMNNTYTSIKYIDLGTVHDPKTGIPQKGLIDWKISWHAEPLLLEKIQFSFDA